MPQHRPWHSPSSSARNRGTLPRISSDLASADSGKWTAGPLRRSTVLGLPGSTLVTTVNRLDRVLLTFG
ncbi:hypothetical protein GUJ93_ZPchr0001g29716 [Zizania palustris]|uniref:Uncharacterized protein n=1 Tax=Zizania palustris TaxID=103762 RepID=A0A8J5R679_ZIZPA|nr:hypothetical protein GUJ93_ZPchr0001g29716 [Zizania palustris]